MRRLWFFTFVFLAMLLLSGNSWAKDVSIYIVEVRGAFRDADHLRKALEQELSVIAVAADDPRAEKAIGHLVVDARSPARELTVSFRKMGEVTTRTVDLPADATLAEKTAVLMAGNVARDQASALPTRSTPEPGPEPPAKTVAPEEEDAMRERLAEDELKRLRAVVGYQASLARTRRWVIGGTYAGLGAAFVTTGIVAASSNAASSSDSDYGLLIAGGSVELAFGGLVMAGVFSRSESFEDWIDAETASDQRRAVVLARATREWEERAKRARTLRHTLGTISLALSAAQLGLATYRTVTVDTAAERHDSAVLALSGAGSLSTGLLFMFWEWPLEAAYETYTRSSAGALQMKPSVSMAPVRGGGIASVGFTF